MLGFCRHNGIQSERTDQSPFPSFPFPTQRPEAACENQIFRTFMRHLGHQVHNPQIPESSPGSQQRLRSILPAPLPLFQPLPHPVPLFPSLPSQTLHLKHLGFKGFGGCVKAFGFPEGSKLLAKRILSFPREFKLHT